MKNSDQLIIVPTLNEIGNLEELFTGITNQVDSHILFVDDNSTDGTKPFILDLGVKHPDKVHHIFRPKKMGLATAYIDGFKWGLEKGYSQMVQMDADLSHQPKYLPGFFEGLTTHDAVFGSRYIQGAGVENWSFKRKLLSRGGSLYSRIILGVPIKDFTGGFNAWRAETLRKVRLEKVKSRGYCFQIEMKYRAASLGLNYKEIPIVFPDRVSGESKMSFKIMAEALLKVWAIRFGTKA